MIAGAVALVALASACMPDEPPPPPPAPKVFVVYGDSLVVEARSPLSEQLATLMPDWQIEFRVYGGTAQCDFHGSMIDDAANLNVAGVAIAFSGNDLTSCIQSRAIEQGYRDDALWAASFWRDRNIPVLFVAAPGNMGNQVADRLIPNVYLSVAAAEHVAVVDAAPLFSRGSPAVFALEMPCLVGECSSTITVRSPNGHFCPINDFSSACPPVYSSGAVRYADVIATGIAQLMGIAHPPLRSMVTPPSSATITSSATP